MVIIRVMEVDWDMEVAIFHEPVLWREVVDYLLVRPDVTNDVTNGGTYIDGTTGEGGHARVILQSAPQGRVLGIDRDPRSLERAAQRLGEYGSRFIPAQGSYAEMVELAQARGIDQVYGVLLDLGFSSRQVEASGYGFSFQQDEPLDMRYDPATPVTAADIVNTYPERELAGLMYRYGEEPRSRIIARRIVQQRPIRTTGELAGIVSQAVGGRRGQPIHPATRTFQALRIAVNDELGHLERGLAAAVQLLTRGGRLAVISYHSLEDRRVKAFLAQESTGCVCPPQIPVCVCGHQPTLQLVNRRVIKPAAEEIQSNPRSRSARMRVAQRR